MLPSFTSQIKRAVSLYFKRENLKYYFLFIMLPTAFFDFILPFFINIDTSKKLESASTFLDTGYSIILILVFVIAFLLFISLMYSFYSAAIYNLHWKIAKGTPFTLSEVIVAGWNRKGHLFTTNVVRGILIGIGFILFIVPGILFMLWYYFSPIIASVEVREVDVFKASKVLVKRFFWPILVRQVCLLFIFLAPLLLFRMVSKQLGNIWEIIATPWLGLMAIIIYSDAKDAYLHLVSTNQNNQAVIAS